VLYRYRVRFKYRFLLLETQKKECDVKMSEQKEKEVKENKEERGIVSFVAEFPDLEKQELNTVHEEIKKLSKHIENDVETPEFKIEFYDTHFALETKKVRVCVWTSPIFW
jgi:hypothetical protein